MASAGAPSSQQTLGLVLGPLGDGGGLEPVVDVGGGGEGRAVARVEALLGAQPRLKMDK